MDGMDPEMIAMSGSEDPIVRFGGNFTSGIMERWRWARDRRSAC